MGGGIIDFCSAGVIKGKGDDLIDDSKFLDVKNGVGFGDELIGVIGTGGSMTGGVGLGSVTTSFGGNGAASS
jgi:hypothetical protein